MKQGDVDDLYDDADLAFDKHRQECADAFSDGRKVGRMGLGAGLCPQGYSDDEQKEWMCGFTVGVAQLLTARKAA